MRATELLINTVLRRQFLWGQPYYLTRKAFRRGFIHYERALADNLSKVCVRSFEVTRNCALLTAYILVAVNRTILVIAISAEAIGRADAVRLIRLCT